MFMRVFSICGLFLTALLISACGSDSANSVPGNGVSGANATECQSTNDTPTEAYKRLFAAVKSRNVEEIKRSMSTGSLGFAEMLAGQQKNPVEKVLENGFTSSTMAAELPEIRDERVNCNSGAVEVWNSKENTWQDLPFIIEDGMWKLAVGEMFSGGYQSPGKGRDTKEKEAANAMRPANTIPSGNSNVNTNRPVKMNVPQPPKP